MTETDSAPDATLQTVRAGTPSDANSSPVTIDIEAEPQLEQQRALMQRARAKGLKALHAPHRHLSNIETAPTAERGPLSSNAVPQSIRENWPQISASRLKSTIYSRITRLAYEAVRNPRSAELNAKSLRTFLTFLNAVQQLNPPTPQLTLTPNGHLVAVWHKDSSHYINAMFKPDGLALYRVVNGKVVNEGRDTIEGLASLLGRDNAWPM